MASIQCKLLVSCCTAQANLTANMTVSQLGASFNTLQDLAQSGLPFGVPADSSIAAYFMNSSDQTTRMLRPMMVRICHEKVFACQLSGSSSSSSSRRLYRLLWERLLS
jgi:hypothetical protein